jgi:hypothetical protein
MKIEELYQELQFLSDRLSTQVRTVALSVIALVWLFVAGASQLTSLPAMPSRQALLRIAALALASLVFDYLQYVFGYLAANALRKTAERGGAKSAEYDYADWRYRARSALFWLKQLTVLASVAWLGLELVRALR